MKLIATLFAISVAAASFCQVGEHRKQARNFVWYSHDGRAHKISEDDRDKIRDFALQSVNATPDQAERVRHLDRELLDRQIESSRRDARLPQNERRRIGNEIGDWYNHQMLEVLGRGLRDRYEKKLQGLLEEYQLQHERH